MVMRKCQRGRFVVVWFAILPLLALLRKTTNAFAVVRKSSPRTKQFSGHHPLYANGKDWADENKSPPESNGDGVSRRGILQSFLGGAFGMVAGDMLLNLGMTAATKGGGAGVSTIANTFRKIDFQRVLRFGTKYEASGAIASEELLAWVAAQKSVAVFPEIKAWIAAQQKLQTIRGVATVAATASSSAAVRTTGQVTTAAGIGLEEGLVVTAAVGKAAKEVLSSASNDIVDATNNTTSPISIALEHHEEGKLNGNNEADSATEFSIEDVESGTSS